LSVLGDQTIYWDGGELARKRANIFRNVDSLNSDAGDIPRK
jgi:hypothetical protein